MATAAAPRAGTASPSRSRATVAAIGADRVAIRLSPYGAFNEMGAFAEVEPQFLALARELGALGLAYLHLVDHS